MKERYEERKTEVISGAVRHKDRSVVCRGGFANARKKNEKQPVKRESHQRTTSSKSNINKPPRTGITKLKPPNL